MTRWHFFNFSKFYASVIRKSVPKSWSEFQKCHYGYIWPRVKLNRCQKGFFASVKNWTEAKKLASISKPAPMVIFGLGWNWTDAKKGFLPQLKIEPRPYPLIRVQIVNTFHSSSSSSHLQPPTSILSSLSLSRKPASTIVPPFYSDERGHYFDEPLWCLLPHF